MKNYLCLCIIVFFAGVSSPAKGQLYYEDASLFPLFGKITDKTETRYERLPSGLKKVIRRPVWELSKNTAGLLLRFRTNSTTIGLKWSLYENRLMNHMTLTGIKGFDLYCLEGNEWVFVNSARPSGSALENEAVIINNREKTEKEFLLFFPLYDGVVNLEIGIDSTACLLQPEIDLPIREKPIIGYGTSILQGGCATRPGMAHSNILVRRFNREFINLGFSGNGQLDYEIAELIADSHPSLIILDFMPNVNVTQIKEKTEQFYRIIRSSHPEIPILFIENPVFPQAIYDLHMQKSIKEKNEALRIVFSELEKSGEKNIELVSAEGVIGYDNEATVDGIHFTDLGFMRYADFLYPYIKKYLYE